MFTVDVKEWSCEMEDTKRDMKESAIKRTGWFLLSFTPFIYFFAIQFFAMVMVAFEIVFSNIGSLLLIDDESEYMQLVMQIVNSSTNELIKAEVVSQILGIICFALWYYYSAGKPKIRAPKEVLNSKAVGYLVGLCVSVNILISLAMGIAEKCLPDIMSEYEEMLETAGLNDLSLYVMLTAVILAPIVEELCFRGCTIATAQRAGLPFWVINILQAAVFGAAHMNWIQSTYAFVLGLLLGYVYHRYNSLWASILLHFVFNFLGTVVTTLISGLTVLSIPIVNIILVVIAVFGMCFCLKWITEDTKK